MPVGAKSNGSRRDHAHPCPPQPIPLPPLINLALSSPEPGGKQEAANTAPANRIRTKRPVVSFAPVRIALLIPKEKIVCHSLAQWYRLIPAERGEVEKSAAGAYLRLHMRFVGLARRVSKLSEGRPAFGWFAIEPFANDLPLYRDAILRAVDRNDAQFFIRLGEVLRTQACPTAEFPRFLLSRRERLGTFLYINWLPRPEDGFPGFCLMSHRAITELGRHFLDRPNLHRDAVADRIQELGLLKCSKEPIRRATQDESIRGEPFVLSYT